MPNRKFGRRSIRLPGYDYRQPGAYFVTILVKNRQRIFGKIDDGQMDRSLLGDIAAAAWEDLPSHYQHVTIDEYIIMPNHMHGVIMINDDVRAGFKPAPTKKTVMPRHGLPEIVRAYKTFSARRINEYLNTIGKPLWQRGYYDHIVRDEKSLNRIRQYIIQNPIRWGTDRNNS